MFFAEVDFPHPEKAQKPLKSGTFSDFGKIPGGRGDFFLFVIYNVVIEHALARESSSPSLTQISPYQL